MPDLRSATDRLVKEVHDLTPLVERLSDEVHSLRNRQRLAAWAAGIATLSFLLLFVIAGFIFVNDRDERMDRRERLTTQRVADCIQTNDLITATVNAFNRAGEALYPPDPGPDAAPEEVEQYEAGKAEIDGILAEIRDDPSLVPTSCDDIE